MFSPRNLPESRMETVESLIVSGKVQSEVKVYTIPKVFCTFKDKRFAAHQVLILWRSELTWELSCLWSPPEANTVVSSANSKLFKCSETFGRSLM